MTMRIGQGIDVHAYGAGDHVVLGGVRIDHGQGIVAHSDGDAVIHALCDALLGAAALGDIGALYPDDDARWRDADSRDLLRDCVNRLTTDGWKAVNADVTVAAEAPRLAPHVAAMRTNLATDLGIDVGAVSVKATTTERLGFIGRGEGIAAFAVVLIERD